jgi:hypothetical protein
MGPYKIRDVNRFYRMICLVLVAILLLGLIPMDVAAENKEFNTIEFSEKLTIPRNELGDIDVIFREGKILEVIYVIQEKQGLPVDVWFVNDDNYLLLTSGAQFLFFIDGTGKQVSYTKKIVTLTEHDDYKLVVTNYYSNQTVEVDIVGELREYIEPKDEDDSKVEAIYVFVLIIIIVILVALLIVLIFHNRSISSASLIESKKDSRKKTKDKKGKQEKSKPSSKKGKDKISKGAKVEVSDKKAKKTPKATEFCGNCGAAVDSPFCKNCGEKV